MRTLVSLGVLGILALIIGLVFGIPAYDRYQQLAYARNQVQINDIRIAQTTQLVQVQTQEARIKVEEAKGIAKAQEIINGTLTPQYLQHEAIQAQLEAARNSSHTETIYIPSGIQGIPFVAPLEARGGAVK